MESIRDIVLSLNPGNEEFAEVERKIYLLWKRRTVLAWSIFLIISVSLVILPLPMGLLIDTVLFALTMVILGYILYVNAQHSRLFEDAKRKGWIYAQNVATSDPKIVRIMVLESAVALSFFYFSVVSYDLPLGVLCMILPIVFGLTISLATLPFKRISMLRKGVVVVHYVPYDGTVEDLVYHNLREEVEVGKIRKILETKFFRCGNVTVSVREHPSECSICLEVKIEKVNRDNYEEVKKLLNLLKKVEMVYPALSIHYPEVTGDDEAKELIDVEKRGEGDSNPRGQ